MDASRAPRCAGVAAVREARESAPGAGSFADLLCLYRKRRKFSQSKLAHLAGLHASYDKQRWYNDDLRHI